IKVYKTIILPVVLYGCETWSLTQREEHRLQVFENRVLRRLEIAVIIFISEEFRSLKIIRPTRVYASARLTRLPFADRLVGHVARMDGTRGVHRVLVGKPEGKRPLGRPRRRWEDNLRRDLWEIGVEGDWILLAQDRVRWRALVNSMMNLRVP
ncbi:Putative uncharacterized transposon-derived protein F52C9.6, partial [Zootermopsis nevadensis]